MDCPHGLWPADRAWFVATEIDLPWTGVAGGVELIDAPKMDPIPDVANIDPGTGPGYWRDDS
ncbi:hypothetical protein [Nocardia paucivorans]|uniref:hypothetical protein n=1 Tax=Nocardia paucivorans TaxID=114259 RepID=UPI0002F9AE3B|nr:hypothetical protein [Nocardia paucivorans]